MVITIGGVNPIPMPQMEHKLPSNLYEENP